MEENEHWRYLHSRDLHSTALLENERVKCILECAVMNVRTLAVSIVNLCLSVVALVSVLGVIAVQIVLLIKATAVSIVYDVTLQGA